MWRNLGDARDVNPSSADLEASAPYDPSAPATPEMPGHGADIGRGCTVALRTVSALNMQLKIQEHIASMASGIWLAYNDSAAVLSSRIAISTGSSLYSWMTRETRAHIGLNALITTFQLISKDDWQRCVQLIQHSNPDK